MQSPPPPAKRRRRDARDEDAPAAASDADRLSALPDDILHTLLSLLPAHEAVRTCALGRRWRDVRPRRPRHRRRGMGHRRQVHRVLDGLLRRLRRPGDASPRLESFVFDLNEIDFGFAGLLPSKSNHLHLSRAIWRAGPGAPLPPLHLRATPAATGSPLVSHHLTTLELAHVRVNDRVLDFSSCPSLLDLILHRCYIDAVQMSSQSLNRLIMTDCTFLVDARTRMSLPGLIALKITLLSGRAPFLESMPLLETAIVSLHCDCGDKWGWTGYIRSDNDKSISRLLQGLSEATNLCLLAHRRVCILNADLKWCPTFSKLKNLVRTYSLQTTERYKPREQSCAFDHHKKVEFMCDEVDDRVSVMPGPWAGGSSTAINRRRRALDLRPLVGDRGEDRVVFFLSLSASPRDQRYTLIIDSFSSSPLSRSVNFLARFLSSFDARKVFDGMSPESKKALVEGGGDDRISFLPTALLQHVLSFLQAKEVVRTCVLARRWRHLWKSMPILRVTGAGDARAFHTFTYHLLLLRDRSPLESCTFDFNVFSKDDMPIVNLWIRYVLLCQVRVLTLAIGGHQLTDLPVVSPILTRLELSRLSVNGNCPALEELKMTKCTISADKISSQSLKRLSICECKFKSDGRTVISVPSLLFLQLIAFKSRTPFLEDMPLLVTAKVILSGYHCTDYCYSSDPGYCPIGCTHCYGIDDGSAGCVLLKGLADASNLELIADPKVWFESAENCALICILQHSPFLEKLTLQLSKKPDINMRSRAIYNSMGKSFASYNLKTVEVKCQDIDKKVHKLIMSLNSYGIPLEKINIQQTNESYESGDTGQRWPPAAASGKEAAPFANPSAPASNPRSTGCSEESISDALFLHVLYSPHRVLSRFGARHLFDVMPHPRPRGGDDRLGALPDEALQHVLSFLPLPEAVRTGALARRWRHLWKSMPVLRITGEGRVLNRSGVRRLNRFVNHLLLLRDRSARLDACEINLGTFRSQDDPQINLWIRHVLLCEAQDLWVHLSIDNNSFEMENLALVSRHLTRLELSNVVLKDHFLNFSSCPALEELVTRNCHIEAEEILSESLKWLTAVDCVFSSYPRTRISLPSLVTLELTEPWGSTPVLESMPSLLTASIKLTDCDDHCGKEEFGGSCDDNACDNCGANGGSSGDCVLLDGLSEAESLELIAKPRVFIFRRDLMWCPTFSKLKTLLLNEWSVAIDLVALICFLQHTPVLEKLTLQLIEAPANWMENEGSYDPTENPFASKQLKVVEVKCEKFDLRVHKIIMIFSTYGVNIEQIYIQRSVIHSEEPTDDSGAGPSRLRTPPISTSENAQLKSTIDQMLRQQQELLAQQQQQHHFLSQLQRRQQILCDITAQLSKYSAPPLSQRPPQANLYPSARMIHVSTYGFVMPFCAKLELYSIDNDSYELEDVALVSQRLMRLDLCNMVLKDYFLNFSCCPVLKELLMRKCCIKARKISSESLKRLTALTSGEYSCSVKYAIFINGIYRTHFRDDHCGKEEFGEPTDDSGAGPFLLWIPPISPVECTIEKHDWHNLLH
uniref:F-box domain-containing protein n=1 Tax=Oryza rufipogon TaxID=4529 RepID=A0A0E0R5D4_ORYRU